MQALFEQLGIADSVTVTGGISEHRKNHLLRESRVGLRLSNEEGWGLSITEFLALEMPVVAYRLPVFEQVFPTQLELVNRGDVIGAATETLALLSDPRRLTKRGRDGSKFVKQYDYRQIAREELDVLETARVGFFSRPER